MQKRKAIIAGLLATVFLATSVSSASARWYHHRGPGPVLGLLGAVVVGAATIATAPFALLADAGRAGPPPRGYDDYDGPPPEAYGPPPPRYYDRRYQDYYGPPPPRYYGY
jgi:ABC-type amino acid transport substrate-binding protein